MNFHWLEIYWTDTYKVFLLKLSLVLMIVGFTTFASYSQPKGNKTVGSIYDSSLLLIELDYIVDKGDTLYSLIFLDRKYTRLTKYQQIPFIEVGNSLNTVYNLFLNCINNQVQKSIKLGGTTILIIPNIINGVKGITIHKIDEAFFYLNEKNLKKLFAR